MRKKILTTVLCLAMGVTLCACKRTTPSVTDVPAPEKNATEVPKATSTVAPTAEPTKGAEEVKELLPITDYEDYVATTKLPENYMGIEVRKITDADVQENLYLLRLDNPVQLMEERAVQEGDVVTIDYVGYLDGVAFEGGTGVGINLEIGSDRYIDGFESGLIGAAAGETRSLELAFPEDYFSTDLAGKGVVFEVTVHSIGVMPELNDEFVNAITGGSYTTVEDFEEYLEEYLMDSRDYLAVIEYLVENTEFGAVNEEYIKAKVEDTKEMYVVYAQMYGMDLDAFMMMYGVTDSEGFWKSIEEEELRMEKERIAMYCVAKAEGITLTEEEYTKYATELANDYSVTVEEFYADYGEESVKQSILMERALELLMDNVVEK